jgi:phosphoenolpyruvate-protein kinase (PTS system EI component)
MGVTSLSLAPRAVPHVARALASRSIAECGDLGRRVASARTPDAARAIATESLAGAIG